MSAPYSAGQAFPHHAPGHQAPGHAPNAPAGTFLSGTKVQVGKHRVIIDKYLSEGGFAHVYLVRVPRTGSDRLDAAVLKRVAVPDKEALGNMRTEVETMKKLKGHKHIVTYIDSHASQLKGGGYEVFLLMEYCAGGGLIDFMNTRLQHRLTEPEILRIFSDVAEGVACMHYLKPPLLHRDLKVENVLISSKDSSKIYKLCDFGSTAPPRPAATTAAEGRLIEDDVQRHTTLQYRSPEMIDVYRKQPIDEKSDIWALGVLLYKLCYYTTPFEEVGQMAILNATFRYPPYPVFSDKIKRLIGWMLREHPKDRPNIYQALKEVCAMRGTELPIKDIYTGRSQSEVRRNQQLPSTDSQSSSPPTIGLTQSQPIQQTVQAIPEVVPMRRGRPTAPVQPASKPSVSPRRGPGGDPFAALDSTDIAARSAAADELAARFPSLDEFSILHDRGTKFQFSQASPTGPSDPAKEALNKRVTEALADDAFAPRLSSQLDISKKNAPHNVATLPVGSTTSRRAPDIQSKASQSSRTAQANPIHQPTPTRPSMISTGTMTSPAASPKPPLEEFSKRPIWRVPADKSPRLGALSQQRTTDATRHTSTSLNATSPPISRTLAGDQSSSKLQTATLALPKSPSSSRPSLEGSRPSALDLSETITRAKSANSHPRPTSAYIESDLSYLREREATRGRPAAQATSNSRFNSEENDIGWLIDEKEGGKTIDSDVDFLRAMENDETSKRKDRRSSSGPKHSKRTSLSGISLSGTKNILAGKFGEAFKRFEHSNPPNGPSEPSLLSSSPGTSSLPPFTGVQSSAVVSRDDDEEAVDETQELSPEMRREMERRRLSQEERRVAEAAAEYKRQLASQGESGKVGTTGSSTRASTIQSRVKNLLDESKSTHVPKTAEGYGRYTKPPSERQDDKKVPPSIARKPVTKATTGLSSHSTPLLANQKSKQPIPINPTSHVNASAPSLVQHHQRAAIMRPSAPPKPKALRTGNQDSASLLKVASAPSATQSSLETDSDLVPDDWEGEFSKKYPSLSGLEMVETNIESSSGLPMRIRDV